MRMKPSSLLRVLGVVGLSFASMTLHGQSNAVWALPGIGSTSYFNEAGNWVDNYAPQHGDSVTIPDTISSTVIFSGPVTAGDSYLTFNLAGGILDIFDTLRVATLNLHAGAVLKQTDGDIIATQGIFVSGGQWQHISGALTIAGSLDDALTIANDGTSLAAVGVGGTSQFGTLKVLSDGQNYASYGQSAGSYVYGLTNLFVGGGGDARVNLLGGTLKVANHTPITVGWIDQNTPDPADPVPGQQARLTLSGDAILLLGNAAEDKITGLNLATHQGATLTVGGNAQLYAEGGLRIGGAGAGHVIQDGGSIDFNEDLSVADGPRALIDQSGGTAEYRNILLSSTAVDPSVYTLSGGSLTADSFQLKGNATFNQTAGGATLGSLLVGASGTTDNLFELSGGTLTATTTAGAGEGGVITLNGGTLNTATLYLNTGGVIEYLSGTLNAQSLNFNGGTFTLAQNRALNVSGDGLVKNTLTFAASNTLDLGGEMRLFGGTFNTVGTVELGSLVLEEGATYTQTGGTATVIDGVELATGSALTVSGGSFTAGGTLVLDDGVTGNLPGGSTLGVSGGASFTTGAATFNRGTAVTLGSGSQTFNGAVNVYGTLTLDSGSDVTAGDLTIGRDYSGTLAGALQFNAGLLDVGHFDIVNSANLYGGTLTADQFTVRSVGAIDWTSTQATVSGDALIGGTVTMSNGQLNAASLALNATDAAFTQSAGTVAITGETRLNANTALARTGGTFGTGSLVFTGGNASFTQSAGSLTTGSLDVTQLASATFALSGGTLRATGNASIFGSGNAGGNDFTVSNNAFLDIDGNLTVSGATEIATSGTARVDVGGAFRVAQGGGEDVRLTIGTGTTINNGTAELGGNGKVSVTLNGLHDVDGAFTLGGASGPQSVYLIQGSGELRAGAVTLAPVAGSSARLDVGGTLAVDGAIEVGAAGGGAGTLRLTTGVINADSLTSHGGTTVTQLGGVMNVTGTLDNGGSYTLSGAAINAGTFVNNNTVTVSSGAAVNTLTGDLTNNGLLMINSTLTVDKTSAAISNTGTILLDHGAQLALYPGATLHNNQGVLGGVGTFGGVSATILDEGYLAPGYGPNETTELTIVGDYTLLAGGHLEIDIASLTVFDSVHFQNGSPEFYGWLDVNFADGFDAVLGDTFDIITGTAAFTTLFRDITTTGLDSGLALSGTDLGTTFRLTVIEAMTSGGGGSGGSPSPVPEPSTWALLLGAAALGVAIWRRHRPSPQAATPK